MMGRNSHHDVTVDVDGLVTISYSDADALDRQVTVGLEDPLCRAHSSVGPLILDIEKTIAQERRTVCASARDFLLRGPRGEKDSGVRPEDARRTVDLHCQDVVLREAGSHSEPGPAQP